MNYDCFLFSHELDLLELRLSELEDWADQFVLVESDRTHSGLSKPLFFQENKERFKRWLPRIRHRVAPLPQGTNDERENAHRRELGYALANLRIGPDDVVHTSDLDEIPALQTLQKWKPEMGICGVESPHSYYYLNCEAGGWGACRIGTWGQIIHECGGDFQKLRHIGRDLKLLRAHDDVPYSGGWHLSFMGGVETIQKKLAWYLHSPTPQETKILDQRWIRLCVNTGISLFYAVREDQDHWFKFVEPRILPRAIDKFRWLVAEGVKFEYQQTTRQLKSLWELMCKRKPTCVLDVGSSDGLTTVAMASYYGPERQILSVHNWPNTSQAEHNQAALGVESLIWSALGKYEYTLVHVHKPEYMEMGISQLGKGGILCGTWYDDLVLRDLKGHHREGDFWWWEKV